MFRWLEGEIGRRRKARKDGRPCPTCVLYLACSTEVANEGLCPKASSVCDFLWLSHSSYILIFMPTNSLLKFTPTSFVSATLTITLAFWCYSCLQHHAPTLQIPFSIIQCLPPPLSLLHILPLALNVLLYPRNSSSWPRNSFMALLSLIARLSFPSISFSMPSRLHHYSLQLEDLLFS